jgi:hypothetical protein
MTCYKVSCRVGRVGCSDLSVVNVRRRSAYRADSPAHSSITNERSLSHACCSSKQNDWNHASSYAPNWESLYPYRLYFSRASHLLQCTAGLAVYDFGRQAGVRLETQSLPSQHTEASAATDGRPRRPQRNCGTATQPFSRASGRQRLHDHGEIGQRTFTPSRRAGRATSSITATDLTAVHPRQHAEEKGNPPAKPMSWWSDSLVEARLTEQPIPQGKNPGFDCSVASDHPRLDGPQRGPEINQWADNDECEHQPRRGPAMVVLGQLIRRRSILVWPVFVLH